MGETQELDFKDLPLAALPSPQCKSVLPEGNADETPTARGRRRPSSCKQGAKSLVPARGVSAHFSFTKKKKRGQPAGCPRSQQVAERFRAAENSTPPTPFSAPATITTAFAISFATAAATEIAPWRTLFLRAGFDDFHRAALDGLIVDGVDGGESLRLDGHFDESESSRASGIAVTDDARAGDGAVLFEGGAEILVAQLEGKIADVEVHRE